MSLGEDESLKGVKNLFCVDTTNQSRDVKNLGIPLLVYLALMLAGSSTGQNLHRGNGDTKKEPLPSC